jgi:hypothetical protein
MRLQLSTTLMMAATDGAAPGAPMCSQFFLPSALGRMLCSHRLCRLQTYAAFTSWRRTFPVFVTAITFHTRHNQRLSRKASS